MEILLAFCLLRCSGLVTALIKQAEKFPSLCSLPSSGGWLNQNIVYSVILNQLGICQIPMPSSRFRLDARLSAEGFSLPDPAGGRAVPCAPGERSDGAVPEGGEGGHAASCATCISIRHGKGFQQRAALYQTRGCYLLIQKDRNMVLTKVQLDLSKLNYLFYYVACFETPSSIFL